MTTTLFEQIQSMGKRAKKASKQLMSASTDKKNAVLTKAAENILAKSSAIVAANKLDLDCAKAMGKDGAFLDRLMLNADRIEDMAKAIGIVVDLDDPVGRQLALFERPNGLNIERKSVPIGVIAMIYESRPNVGADAGALCLKSGNAVILRGGKESINSSKLIIHCFHDALKSEGLSEDCVQLIDTPDREVVKILLGMSDTVDLAIPRGGKGLVSAVKNHAKVPTLLHLDGNCHTYIHAAADQQAATDVVNNAKLRRTGICGATESLVIDESIAATILPKLIDSMQGCDFRGDEQAIHIDKRVLLADDHDFYQEYLAPILSVKIVKDADEAIDFVNEHSSGHTDAIITENTDIASQFLTQVDSAVVMHNASTQFSDGGEFGMGAEIGIATGKIHARGPVGLEQLNTFKYMVHGAGHIRS